MLEHWSNEVFDSWNEESELPNARIAPPLAAIQPKIPKFSPATFELYRPMKFSFTVPSALRPSNTPSQWSVTPTRRHADTFCWRLAILALGVIFPVALMARDPSVIVRSPPLEPSSATLERLEKLAAFRSGPILFRVGCEVVQGRIVKVSVEQSSRYPFLNREGVDWVTKHWSFGMAATGTYHVPLVVGAKTRPGTGQPLPSLAHPARLVPKLSKATWDALLESRPDAAFTVRLTVKVEVRAGAILSARMVRSSGTAMADSEVIEWIKNRWRFQKTAQGRQLFECHLNVDPSQKRRSIVVTSKGA